VANNKQFWRWSSDYLQVLQQQQSWLKASPNQQTDHILLREGNTTPLHWSTTVITNIHPHHMASHAWSRLGILRELRHPTTKYNSHRAWIVKYSVVSRVSVCSHKN
jgi:hypothetical protein